MSRNFRNLQKWNTTSSYLWLTFRIEKFTQPLEAGTSRNNIAAFWEDPSWAILWPSDRQPRSLLRNRECLRHQKAVDTNAGGVVGYARWVLPGSRSCNGDCSIVWAEAQVSPADAAWWSPRKERKGIATALVERLLRFAGEIGVPVFTIAFEAARGIYTRHGFREIGRFV
ncbi:hypothetical protein BDV25DRAFT_170325 [Aspergillus avenaceus]|uniref:N-acetyltransferase domain-containing protein n=1 Tax=Aspergillus avenaceus TaxID=36643 RepID=A0A5N6UA27_ASPAV|nr:hypothetical protein BDV25DRAFT_170325 [Aspergillus avenaceus]